MQQGWVYQPDISHYELLLLNNSLKRYPTIFSYCPIAVAKREECGTKYHFLCIARSRSSLGSPTHFTDIEVYKPIKGHPYISRIKRIDFDQLLW